MEGPHDDNSKEEKQQPHDSLGYSGKCAPGATARDSAGYNTPHVDLQKGAFPSMSADGPLSHVIETESTGLSAKMGRVPHHLQVISRIDSADLLDTRAVSSQKGCEMSRGLSSTGVEKQSDLASAGCKQIALAPKGKLADHTGDGSVSVSPVSAPPISVSPVSAPPVSVSPISASPVSASPQGAISLTRTR